MIECTQCLFNSENLPQIQVNEKGICTVCTTNMKSIEITRASWHTLPAENRWQELRKKRKGKYDGLIGVSGGIDSSYLVHLAHKAGLYPLLIHVDGGWNEPIAVTNIKKLVAITGFDYTTNILDWESLKDAQRAFVLAEVMDIDLPFENALLKALYSEAKKWNIQTIVFGYNMFTEGYLPESFTHYKLDKRNIIDIQKKYGRLKPRSKMYMGTFENFYYERIRKIQFTYPLNWFPYDREEAKSILQDVYNWEDYGGKHHENHFTKFYQQIILPQKFGINKELAHLSMLICSGQLSREEAKSMVTSDLSNIDPQKEFFCKKLDLDIDFLNKYLSRPGVDHRSFKSDLDYYDRLRPVYRFLKKSIGFSWFRNDK